MSGRVPDSSIVEEELLEMIVFDAEEEVKKKNKTVRTMYKTFKPCNTTRVFDTGAIFKKL